VDLEDRACSGGATLMPLFWSASSDGLIKSQWESEKKKDLTVNGRSVCALCFQQYVGSCKIKNVNTVLPFMNIEEKTYFLPLAGPFFLFLSLVSLSLVFGRLLAISSTLDAWRLQVTGPLFERVRAGIL
jgi:hypothetical protein